MAELIGAILAIAAALALASLLLPVAERFRVPHTVLLAVLGIALGILVDRYGGQARAYGIVGELVNGLSSVTGRAEAFLYIFLPPLLFTAGLTIDVRRLIDDIWAVMLLAIVAVFLCIVAVGGLLHLATGLDIFLCLLLGAVVSTTDPAAVIGVLRDVGAPRRLSILAEGESLFNDAAAITVFGVLIAILINRALPDASTPGLGFLREFLGGIALGYALARLAILLLLRLGHSSLGVTSITVGLAYLAYVLGDRYIHVSGVIAVVAAALTMAALGPTRLQPRTWESLRETWHQLEFWANSLIFLLAATVAAQVLDDLQWRHVLAVAVVYVAAFASRAFTLFGLLPMLEATGRSQPVNKGYRTILFWGGLRGAVTLALALVAYGNGRLPAEVREFVATVATLFVLLTLFVNAPSLRPMMRYFRLNELDETDKALRDRVLKVSREKVGREVDEIAEAYGAAPQAAAEPQAETPSATYGPWLPADVREAYGLRVLCAREREHYLAHFEHRTISRTIATQLITSVDRLIDRVRTDGVPGYDLALQQINAVGWRFRVALSIYQRIGWERPFAEQLADRFETLMATRVVLGEMCEDDRGDFAALLGEDVASTLIARAERRVEAVDRALRALSLQYGGYAEVVRAQHIERIAIRLEGLEYERHWANMTIGREVYDDLQRELEERRTSAMRRAPLRISRELAQMISRVPIFARLNDAAVREVGSRLRPRVALPGEKVVEKGQQGDAMYFITAGHAVVKLAVGDVVLRDGDFFGEMALLQNQPRNADVVADGSCHLMELSATDFRRLLDANPDIRSEIEGVAERRRSSNAARS
ncbi:MAG: cation:proton antiporter [Alphaproteobacteria bacterium]|nr:cation:proton antiporter [Alphaproteobacteria bacterium]MCW5741711.1 cation:proton antiporter [Alphaproteobacteria bacterium]